MPVADTKKSPTVTPSTTGHAVPLKMRTAVVESRFTPVQNLLTHITGGRYVVEYYQQRLGADDHARPQDINNEPAQQSYDRIRQFEIRLQGELSMSIDDKSKEWDVTGEAIVYPGFTPQAGDMFRADVGQGNWGILAVTNASPTSIQSQTCYRITFRMTRRMDEVWYRDLERKVVDKLHFVMDFLREGKNPFVADEEHQAYRRLDQLFSTMVADYFRSFYSDVNNSLIIPGQQGGAYDPFLVKAVMSILEVTDHPILGELTRHAVDVQYAYKTTTIWDALLMVEPSYLYLSAQRVGLASKSIVKDRGVFGGAYWNRFNLMMFPHDERIDADRQFTTALRPLVTPLADAGAALTDIERLILNNSDSVNMDLVDKPSEQPMQALIPSVNKDLYYVFSHAFYQKDMPRLSRLETMVWSMLEHNEIDIPQLYEMVDMSRRWDRLERFYFVPVLMLLCVIAFRGPSHG